MFTEFLDVDITCPTELRDFPEWHKGVKYYGFWAIEVSTQACHHKINKHKTHLADKLHRHYLRQPHITLMASGLLSDNHFHQDIITTQVSQIKKSAFKAFSLTLSACNSFSVCPYLSVLDPLCELDAIRACLNNSAEQNNPAKYTPNVTLGFYNKAYATTEIVREIIALSTEDIEFKVNEIVFAQYETKDVQGPYQVLHRIKLDGI